MDARIVSDAISLERTPMRRFKPYPAYKHSGVEWLGEIPEHWEVKRLRSTVTSCQNGVWGDDPDGLHDIACVRVADFDRLTFRVHGPGTVKLAPENAQEYIRTRFAVRTPSAPARPAER